MVGINLFIGSSIPALQRVANQMDEELINFGNEEKAQLGPNMPLKDITLSQKSTTDRKSFARYTRTKEGRFRLVF